MNLDQSESELSTQPPVHRPGVRKFWYLVRLAAILGLIPTTIGCFASAFWIADLFAQFKIQLAFGMLVIACLFVISRQWIWVGVCLVGILINGRPAWPYIMPGNVVAKADVARDWETKSTQLRLLSLNVLTSNRNASQVLELIEQERPDFVVLMEIDSKWEQSLDSLRQSFPFAEFRSRQDNFGIAFLSRHPWSEIDVFDSESLELPSIDVRFDQDMLTSASVVRNLRLIATHPIPPVTTRAWLARNEQLNEVAGRFDSNAANIMVGDLNLTPWSPHFDRILQIGRLTDSAHGFGLSPTWYLFPTWLGGIKIDHILVSSDVSSVQYRVGPDVGSDHRAVILDFHVLRSGPEAR